MAKMKQCPICGKAATEGIVDLCLTSYKYVMDAIKKEHPEWVEEDGACPKCMQYYKRLGGEKA